MRQRGLPTAVARAANANIVLLPSPESHSRAEGRERAAVTAGRAASSNVVEMTPRGDSAPSGVTRLQQALPAGTAASPRPDTAVGLSGNVRMISVTAEAGPAELEDQDSSMAVPRVV